MDADNKAAKRQPAPDAVRLLTLGEVANALSLKRHATWQKVRLGEIPGAVRVGRNWRVRYSVFKNWLDRGCPEVR